MSDANQAYSLLLFLIGQNLRAGITGKAMVYANTARIINPTDPRAYEALSYCQLLSGEPEASLQTLADFEKQPKEQGSQGKTYNMYFVEVHAHISQGNLDQAKPLMPAMLEAAKKNAKKPTQYGMY